MDAYVVLQKYDMIDRVKNIVMGMIRVMASASIFIQMKDDKHRI